MGRALGINAVMAIAFESVYGTAPVLRLQQGAVRLDHLRQGTGPARLRPARLRPRPAGPRPRCHQCRRRRGGAGRPAQFRLLAEGAVRRPGEHGRCRRRRRASPSPAQPIATSTITDQRHRLHLRGERPTGNQILIGANLAATLTAIAVALNASVVTGVAAATYAVVGGNQISVTHDTLGAAGNAFTLAASACPGLQRHGFRRDARPAAPMPTCSAPPRRRCRRSPARLGTRRSRRSRCTPAMSPIRWRCSCSALASSTPPSASSVRTKRPPTGIDRDWHADRAGNHPVQASSRAR